MTNHGSMAVRGYITVEVRPGTAPQVKPTIESWRDKTNVNIESCDIVASDEGNEIMVVLEAPTNKDFGVFVMHKLQYIEGVVRTASKLVISEF